MYDLQGHPIFNERTGRAFQHLKEVKDAQAGLLFQIDRMNRMLSTPYLDPSQRAQIQSMLSTASKLLDKTEEFVPR
jgi:hypothetical protein